MLKTLFKHSYWNGIATLSQQGTTFAANFLIIHFVDRASYGRYALLNLTAFYVANILQLAVGSTTAKFISRYESDKEKLSAVIWICGVYTVASSFLGLLLLAAASGTLARSVFLEPSMSSELAMVSLTIPSLIAIIFLTGLLQGLHSFRRLAISSVVSSVFFLAAVAGGAWGYGLHGAVVGLAIGTALRALMMGIAAAVEIRERDFGMALHWRSLFESDLRREIFRFQMPAGLAGFVTLPTLWLLPTILSRNSQDFSDVASYSVILMLKSIIVLPAAVIAIALQPSVERAWSSQQADTASRIFRTGLMASTAIVSVLTIGAALFPTFIMSAFGSGYVTAAPGLRVMMIAAFAEALTPLFYMRVQASNRMWALIFFTLIPRDVVMLVIAYFLTPVYGLWAIVAAHVVGSLLNVVCAFGLGVTWLKRTGRPSP